jgi:hypothetical protein
MPNRSRIARAMRRERDEDGDSYREVAARRRMTPRDAQTEVHRLVAHEDDQRQQRTAQGGNNNDRTSRRRSGR